MFSLAICDFHSAVCAGILFHTRKAHNRTHMLSASPAGSNLGSRFHQQRRELAGRWEAVDRIEPSFECVLRRHGVAGMKVYGIKLEWRTPIAPAAIILLRRTT